eukprot:393537_1
MNKIAKIAKFHFNKQQVHLLAHTIQSRNFSDIKLKQHIDCNPELMIQIKRLAKQKCNPHQLLQVFDKIKQEGIEYDYKTYLIAQKALITVHCQNKSIKSAKKIWYDIINNDLCKDKLDIQDYYTIIGIFCKQFYTSTALEIFDHMMSKNIKCTPKLYNIVITAATKLKSSERANQIYELILTNDAKLVENDNYIQNGLTGMFLSIGNVELAQKISRNSKRSITTFNILINGMIEDNKYNEAINLFYDMNKQNINPNSIAYSSVGKAIGHLGCLNEANKLFDMVQNDSNLDMYTYENIALCNCFITMFGKCGNISKAMEIFEYLLNNKCNIMNIITWNSIINIHFYDGNYEKMLDLYCKLISIYDNTKNMNKKVNIKPQMKTFQMAMYACSQLKNSEISKQIYKDIYNSFEGVKNITNPEIYKAIIEMHCICNGIDEAIDVWRETLKMNPSVVPFTLMIKLCINYGNNMKAFELFDEMQNVYNIKPDTTAFVTILKACKHETLIKKMHELIIETDEGFCKDKTIARVLINAYNICGNKQMVNQVLKCL